MYYLKVKRQKRQPWETILALVYTTYCLCALFVVLTEGNDQSLHADDPVIHHDNGTISGRLPQSPESQLILYRRLFKQNHAMQIEAVKSLQKFHDHVKQYKMVEIMLHQIFKVNSEARHNLSVSNYRPGDPFPQNDTVKTALSKVLENTAMFGELVLRLPDITHSFYDTNREWHILMSWGAWFANESRVLDVADEKFLHLVCQEIGLVEKSGSFVNPYTSDYQIKEDLSKLKSPEIEPVKKKKKAKAKGPRLSSQSRGDL